MRSLLSLLIVATLGASSAVAPTSSAAAAVSSALPSHSSVIRAGQSAVDYWYAHGGGATSTANWRWAPYFMGVDALYRETGDLRYRVWLESWGERNYWNPDAPKSPTSNPDSRAAIQVWQDSAALGIPTDLDPSDAIMADDLDLEAQQYWWIDSMFMGLPLWPRWETRTGDPAYGEKHAEFYDFLKTDGRTPYRTGCTGTGLFDGAENLWWRDCKYVAQRDSQGHKVFWSRGNGWVMGAMARTIAVLPKDDPQYAEYRSMLQRMSKRIVPLQGADGMWRTSLLSPSLYPAAETSGTALFTYAMAYGIRIGALDRTRYLPVVAKAWNGMTSTALKSDGFLSNCQGVGEAPGTPSTTASIGYCVGAYALAASEVAKLSPDLALRKAVTVSSAYGADTGAKLVDGSVLTGWKTRGFPQTAVIDLGAAMPIGSTQLSPRDRIAYRYRIETSSDRVHWTSRIDRRTNSTTGPRIDDFPAPVTARYLRLTVTGIATTGTTWMNLGELKAFGP